jgi:predicted nucleic acid-binding protein
MIVVDTNVIAYLYILGKYTPQAEELFLRDNNWVSSILWKSEFQNILVKYIRSKLISIEHALKIIEKAEVLMYGKEYTVPSHKVIELATSSTCTAYDCEFVALSKMLNVPLVTADKQIIQQFPNITIPLENCTDYFTVLS